MPVTIFLCSASHRRALLLWTTQTPSSGTAMTGTAAANSEMSFVCSEHERSEPHDLLVPANAWI